MESGSTRYDLYRVERIHLSVKGLVSKETMGLHRYRWGSKTQKHEISNKLTSFKLHTLGIQR